jgi:hypothetical protein
MLIETGDDIETIFIIKLKSHAIWFILAGTGMYKKTYKITNGEFPVPYSAWILFL